MPPGVLDPLWLYQKDDDPDALAAALGRQWLRNSVEAERLGAQWILIGPMWNQLYLDMWRRPMNRDLDRYALRHVATESGPQADLLLTFEILY